EYVNSHEKIKVLGFIESKELSAIYRLATSYCQPSLYEGFGLPLLEAMTAGCLIVSSNTSSLPEIYPEGTITFNPNKVDSIKEALNKALNLKVADLRKLISFQNKEAAEFSWQKTATLTLTVYKRVISKSKAT
ncbi:glycosyltransferase, partial [Candidatus Collierbacteria bacterium]|nr:glycosyltransferase [Candidatus Collierbacteria bacterium]